MKALERYGKVVLWGGRRSLDSTRHVYRHFSETLRKLGVPAVWVDDDPEHHHVIQPGDLVFAFDIWGQHIAPQVPGVDYVLHNFSGDHAIFDGLDPERLLRLQVYTDAATGEAWDEHGVRRYDREARVLFQPWGTNLLAEEFLEPVFQGHQREVVFVGAVWDDNGLGNKDTIAELMEACLAHGLKFVHKTHVSDEENVESVRGARFAPAFAGGWQQEHNYLPCRCFKHPSYGVLLVTNVPKFREIYAGCSMPAREDLHDVIGDILKLRRDDYLELVREQQRVSAGYTYRESLIAMARALEEGR